MPSLLPVVAGVALTALVLVVAVNGVPLSETMRCHVCGPPSSSSRAGSLFPGQPPAPACQAEPGPDARECPTGYKGCLTVYDGKAKTLTRTCAESAYDPCQVANGVVYCYCSGRLCNAQTEQQMRYMLYRDPATRTDDDDDEGEEDGDDGGGAGSGDSDPERWAGRGGEDTPRLDDLVPDADYTSSSTTTTTTGRRTPNDELYMSEETTQPTEPTRAPTPGKGSARRAQAGTALVLAALCAATLSRWHQ